MREYTLHRQPLLHLSRGSRPPGLKAQEKRFRCPAGRRCCTPSTTDRHCYPRRRCGGIPRQRPWRRRLRVVGCAEYPIPQSSKYRHCTCPQIQHAIPPHPPAPKLTATGTLCEYTLPVPSPPKLFAPQHHRPPPLATAQVWSHPAAMAMTETPANEGTGLVP